MEDKEHICRHDDIAGAKTEVSSLARQVQQAHSRWISQS